jgi:hypothetical protein
MAIVAYDNWSVKAREVIAEVDKSLPETATLAERKKALFDAYPFGQREMWPYKAWCKAQKAYLARFMTSDQKVPAHHLSPLERMMARAKEIAHDPQ